MGIGGGIRSSDPGYFIISMGSQGIAFDEWFMNRPTRGWSERRIAPGFQIQSRWPGVAQFCR